MHPGDWLICDGKTELKNGLLNNVLWNFAIRKNRKLIKVPVKFGTNKVKENFLKLESSGYLTFHNTLVSLTSAIYFIHRSFQVIKQIAPVTSSQVIFLPRERTRQLSASWSRSCWRFASSLLCGRSLPLRWARFFRCRGTPFAHHLWLGLLSLFCFDEGKKWNVWDYFCEFCRMDTATDTSISDRCLKPQKNRWPQ